MGTRSFAVRVSRATRYLLGLVLLAGLLIGPSALAAPAVRPYEGTLDTTFDPGTGCNDGAFVYAIAVQPDGKILIGGNFDTYNGTARIAVARLNSNGSLDTSFSSRLPVASGVTVQAIAVQPDGKILIGGYFATYDGFGRNSIARLNSDGSLDPGFDPGDGVNGNVLALLHLPDGKVLIAGWFDTFDGTARANIARLNPNGSLDTSFAASAWPDNRVHSLARQSDGKILIGGYFNCIGPVDTCLTSGTTRHHIARLDGTGALDSSFNPGIVGNDYSIIYGIAVQPDGRIIVGGNFESYNGSDRMGLARANPNGTNDNSFVTGDGVSYIYAIYRDLRGRTVIGGTFQSYDTTQRMYLARVLPNGSIDASFDPGQGAESFVYAIAIQHDGKVLIGGSFAAYDGTPRSRIARVNAFGYTFLPLSLRFP